MDSIEVRRALDIFKPDGALVEIRAIGIKKKGDIWSGYFTNHEDIIKAIQRFDDGYNLYFIFNSIKKLCYSMQQKDQMMYGVESTTDKHIDSREWILIDFDPERAGAKINSTAEEKEYSRVVANKVRNYLRDNGFNYPIVCDSGSGYHLLYRIDSWACTAENDELVSNFLNALSMMFSDDKVGVDIKVGNPARITKLYGTIAQKGSNTKERPYRQSKILVVPKEVVPTDKEYFKKIAEKLPKPERPTYENRYSQESFDIDSFLSKHGIQVAKDITDSMGVRKIVLSECPFDSSHKAPDSAIFISKDGAIGFTCFHSHCSQYTWKDLRMKFEPDAYNRREVAEMRIKSRNFDFRPQPKEVFTPIGESSEKGKKWLNMSDIKFVDLSTIVTIPTGFTLLDKKIMGLMLGDVTVLSGLSGTGKTSWIDCLALNVVQMGYKVAIWSGELQDFRFQGWIDQIAAGKNYVCKKEGYDNFYYAPSHICDKVNRWLDGKLFLYNNNYNNRWMQLFSDVKELVEKENVQLIVLDNLMSLQIDDYDGDKYSKQTAFINDLKEYAKSKNVHIILVAHPRKEGGFLRKESISGTADLTNLADNVIILHRVNKDFETRAGEFWGKDKVVEYLKYSTVIELCKNRSLGVVDLIVGMYYEQESRRLKNEIAEHIVYGWQEDPKPMAIPIEEEQHHSFNGYQQDYSETEDDIFTERDYVPF